MTPNGLRALVWGSIASVKLWAAGIALVWAWSPDIIQLVALAAFAVVLWPVCRVVGGRR